MLTKLYSAIGSGPERCFRGGGASRGGGPVPMREGILVSLVENIKQKVQPRISEMSTR